MDTVRQSHWRVESPLTPALSPEAGERGKDDLFLPLPASGERAGVRGLSTPMSFTRR